MHLAADTAGVRARSRPDAHGVQVLDVNYAEHAIEVAGLKVKNDGNNVSIDREARLLAENALRFSIASQLIRSEVRTLRSAIQEGKG